MKSDVSPAVRCSSDSRPRRLRSAVTNDRRLFVEGDGRSAWTRRFRDLIAGHASDLGGPELLSAAQLSLIKRASALETELEQMEGRLSSGVVVDLDVFARVTGHLRRILETLGLERRPREIEDLTTYLERQYGADQSTSIPDTSEPDPASEAAGENSPFSDAPNAAEGSPS